MSAAPLPSMSVRVHDLRAEFDATFVRPIPPSPPAASALLLLCAGGERIAVKRDETTGLVRADNVVPTPSRSPGFVGLAGIRGELYPVWSLAGLLGREPCPVEGDTGWLVLAAARPGVPCAFACETFDHMAFISAQDIAPPGGSRPMVSCDGALVPLIDLAALEAEIHRCRGTNPSRTPP
ncbi:MAG: chemotaxis protein CheW [Opitutae bacterium]|nr:chemotaxis protein CheW [Opitutae bacterium]